MTTLKPPNLVVDPENSYLVGTQNHLLHVATDPLPSPHFLEARFTVVKFSEDDSIFREKVRDIKKTGGIDAVWMIFVKVFCKYVT